MTKKEIKEELKKLYSDLQSSINWLYTHIINEEIEIVDKIYISKDVISDFLLIIKDILEGIYINWQLFMKDQLDSQIIGPTLLWFDSVTFDISTTNAKQYAELRAWDLVSGINENGKAEIKWLVDKAIHEWWTKAELTSQIQDTFDNFTKSRSELIAQQEVALAHWGGKFTQFKETCSLYWITWWKKAYTESDDKVRATHIVNADAWWIPADQEFPWTWSMHEPFGYNCRCRTVYRMFKPED